MALSGRWDEMAKRSDFVKKINYTQIYQMDQELPQYHRKPEKDYFEQRGYFNTKDVEDEDEDESLELPHQSNPHLSIVPDQYTPLLSHYSDIMIRSRKRRLCICGTIAGVLILIVLILLICLLPRGHDSSNPHEINLSEFSHELIDFIVPKHDQKEYKAMRLSNDLQVIVIRDPSSQNSAASISVQAGSGIQDRQLPGQAHYLEHGLFLGSRNFPAQDALFQFVMGRGGGGNAYTAMEETNYFFQVDNAGFTHAFDILTDMVAAPLLAEEPLSRQYNAVNSEYEKDFILDGWKFYQLVCHLANEGSELNRFTIGNTDTLHTIPLEKGLNVTEMVREFYNNYYSANLMTASVYGNQPMTDLMALADSTLSQINNNERQIPDLANPAVESFNENNLGRNIIFTPVAKKVTLFFVLSLPPTLKLYKQSPELFVLDLLNREHVDSIQQFLYSRGWIKNYGAGLIEKLSDETLLEVEMELTKEGRSNIRDMKAAFFEYLRIVGETLISADAQNFLKERQMLKFDYSVQFGSPYDTVSSLSSALHHTDPKYILAVNRVCFEFDNSLLQTIADALRPESALIFTAIPEVIVSETELEPYFNTTYSNDPIKPEDLAYYRANNFPSLKIQIDDTYRPTNTEVLCVSKKDNSCKQGEYNEEPSQLVPHLVYFSEGAQVWWKFDKSLNLPKTAIQILIEGQFDPSIERMVVELEILTEAIILNVKRMFANAGDYGIQIRIQKVFNGIEIKVEGFTSSVTSLVQKLTEYIHKIQIFKGDFELAQEIVMEGYKLYVYEQPYNVIREDLYCLVNKFCFSKEEKTDYGFFGISLADINRFSRTFFSKVYGKVLVVGNIKKEDARDLGRNAVEALGQSALTRREPQSVIELSSASIWKDALQNPKEKNDATLIYYQIGAKSAYELALLSIYSMISQNYFFNILRTQMQLGYVVKSSMVEYSGVLGFYILVQGSAKEPTDVGDAIIKTVETVNAQINNMKEDQLEALKEVLRSSISSNPKTLDQMLRSMWGNIEDNSYMFRDKAVFQGKIDEINLDVIKSFSEMLLLHNYIRIELWHGKSEKELETETSRNGLEVTTSEYQHYKKNGRYFPNVDNLDNFKKDAE